MLSPATYNNQNTFRYILQEKHSQKTSKPNNQKHWSTSPKTIKWFFVNEKLSHISSQLDQLLDSSVGTHLNVDLYLCHGVHVFGFIALIIVGGKKGSNRLRLGGAIFQILLLMRPEAGKLRSYPKKWKNTRFTIETCDCISTCVCSTFDCLWVKFVSNIQLIGYRISPVRMCVKEGSCTGNHHTTIYPKKNIHQIISKISLLCVVLIQASNIIKPLPLPPSNVGGCTSVERTGAAWRTPGAGAGGAAAGAAGAWMDAS